MMKHLHLYTTIFLFSLFCSCKGPNSYIKTLPYITFAEDKGDFEAQGTIGFSHAESCLSYSPLRSIELRTQGYYGSIGQALDLSAGLYYANNWFRTSIYAGVGRGDLDQTKRRGVTRGSGDDDPLQHVYGRFDKSFIQPEIGFILSEHWQLALYARWSHVKYQHLRYSQTSFSGYTPKPEYNLYEGKPSGLVVEPVLAFRYRDDVFNSTLILGWTEDDFTDYYPHYMRSIISLNIGLSLNFNKTNAPHENIAR